jgi:hypothetical protein
MSDAPERIWVAAWREGGWSEGDWDDNEGKTLNEKPCIQYVRADSIEALTAKLAKAVELGDKMAKSIEGNYYTPGLVGEWRATLAEIEGEKP